MKKPLGPVIVVFILVVTGGASVERGCPNSGNLIGARLAECPMQRVAEPAASSAPGPEVTSESDTEAIVRVRASEAGGGG